MERIHERRRQRASEEKLKFGMDIQQGLNKRRSTFDADMLQKKSQEHFPSWFRGEPAQVSGRAEGSSSHEEKMETARESLRQSVGAAVLGSLGMQPARHQENIVAVAQQTAEREWRKLSATTQSFGRFYGATLYWAGC